MKISQLFIYPIKSLTGISVQEAVLTARGLKYDRRFMLVTPDGKFLTQRTLPQMTLLETNIEGDELVVNHRGEKDELRIPLEPTQFEGLIKTAVFDSTCQGRVMDSEINDWFSRKLETECQLIYMTDDLERPISRKHNKGKEHVSYADGYPYLLLGEESMDDLNKRLETPVSITRFRANLIFEGGLPFEEDDWKAFQIGEQPFRVTKPCARCQVPNINPETAEMEKEPNRTLATYRRIRANKICFGVSAVWEGTQETTIKIGDEIISDNSCS